MELQNRLKDTSKESNYGFSACLIEETKEFDKIIYSLVRGTYGIRTLHPDHLMIGTERWVLVVSETQADPVGTSIHY